MATPLTPNVTPDDILARVPVAENGVQADGRDAANSRRRSLRLGHAVVACRSPIKQRQYRRKAMNGVLSGRPGGAAGVRWGVTNPKHHHVGLQIGQETLVDASPSSKPTPFPTDETPIDLATHAHVEPCVLSERERIQHEVHRARPSRARPLLPDVLDGHANLRVAFATPSRSERFPGTWGTASGQDDRACASVWPSMTVSVGPVPRLQSAQGSCHEPPARDGTGDPKNRWRPTHGGRSGSHG